MAVPVARLVGATNGADSTGWAAVQVGLHRNTRQYIRYHGGGGGSQHRSTGRHTRSVFLYVCSIYEIRGGGGSGGLFWRWAYERHVPGSVFLYVCSI